MFKQIGEILLLLDILLSFGNIENETWCNNFRVLQQMIRMNLKHKDAKICEIFIKFDDRQPKN
jgi:hypothetical protein